MQKCFNLLISDPSGMDWWKNRGSKITWDCPFNLYGTNTLLINLPFFHHQDLKKCGTSPYLKNQNSLNVGFQYATQRYILQDGKCKDDIRNSVFNKLENIATSQKPLLVRYLRKSFKRRKYYFKLISMHFKSRTSDC
jgi:hypothetical protein